MRTMLQAVRQSFLPVLAGLAALAACDTPTVPRQIASPELRSGTGPLADRLPGLKIISMSDREDFAPIGGWSNASGPTITCGPLTLQTTYIGSGVMTHGGKDSSRAVWQTCHFDADGHLVVNGVGALATASGDSLIVEFVQTFTTLLPSTSTFDIVMTITDGTGRFEGATGQAIGVGGRQDDRASWQLNSTLFLTPKQ
ncbi:MAG TPA: hypothetical protein VLN49_23325 [Gemmatimonadaceae bacterium]|nr:hypothetical protein [Gemmatimonadaceae bacterium]